MYLCDNCGDVHGGYAQLVVHSRGKPYRFVFCSLDCLIDWARGVAALPDIGLEVGPRRR